MQDILHQVSLIPGIAGVMAYADDGALLAQDFPAIYEADLLRRLAATLAADTIIMAGFREKQGSLDLRFAKGRVIIQAFRGGMVLALCAATVNAQLLGLALTQATRRLEAGLAAGQAPAPPERPAAAAPAVRSAAPGQVLPNAATILEGLKRCLIRQMGPLGGMVYDSTYADWAAVATPTRKGIEELLIRLAKEFDEPAKQNAFLGEARTLLG